MRHSRLLLLALVAAFVALTVAVSAGRSAVPSGTKCPAIILGQGPKLLQRLKLTVVRNMSCDAADKVMLLAYQDGVDGNQMKLLLPGWNCAGDHMECDGPYQGSRSKSVWGSSVNVKVTGFAAGSTHGLASVMQPTSTLMIQLRLASKRAGIFPPAIFDKSIIGPLNGHECLTTAGSSKPFCFNWRVLVARLDDTEWATGDFWDTRGAGNTDNIHLWVRLLGGTWQEDVSGINVAPLTTYAPTQVLAAWRIH